MPILEKSCPFASKNFLKSLIEQPLLVFSYLVIYGLRMHTSGIDPLWDLW
jgi:hypothetical protein